MIVHGHCKAVEAIKALKHDNLNAELMNLAAGNDQAAMVQMLILLQ